MQEKFKKYYENISKNIKMFRKKECLSQESLAEKIDLSREFINRIENNKEKISLNTLFLLSDFFNIPPEKFFY